MQNGDNRLRGPTAHLAGRHAQTSLRARYGLALILIISAGLLCRSPHLGLPWPLAKWSGSILWGAMVYFLVAFVAPAARPNATFAVAAVIALLVEFSRLYHQPVLDDFRRTLAGALLLGRLFSPWNIAAYLFGIAGATIADRRWFRPPPA